MNSVELPDENEKSQSSASASPCPSPVRPFSLIEIFINLSIVKREFPLSCCLFFELVIGQKAQRLLPTNLYVVLFNFKGREADELDLKYEYL